MKYLNLGKEENGKKQRIRACAFLRDENEIKECLDGEVVVEKGVEKTVSEAVTSAIDDIADADGDVVVGMFLVSFINPGESFSTSAQPKSLIGVFEIWYPNGSTTQCWCCLFTNGYCNNTHIE